MPIKQKVPAPSPETIASYVKKNAAMVRQAQKPTHAHPESVREAEYDGHHIVVKTRYHIEVDGQVLNGHFAVTNDGQVHYHPLPNISFASAIDLVKQLIDLFPADFENGHGGPRRPYGPYARTRQEIGESEKREEVEALMTVTRRNLLTNATVRSDYARGVNLLKAEFTGPTTTNLGIPGPSQRVSTYDLFVVWHHTAMMTLTPPTQADRNAAHRGPIFCPWHRFMLLQLELNLQRVLNDATFGLPYWDWAADGQRPAAQQRTSAVWAADAMGGSGNPVTTGPFRFNQGDPASFRVVIEANVNGRLVQTAHGLRRALGTPDRHTAEQSRYRGRTRASRPMTPHPGAPPPRVSAIDWKDGLLRQRRRFITECMYGSAVTCCLRARPMIRFST